MRTVTHNFIHSEATSKMKKATGLLWKRKFRKAKPEQPVSQLRIDTIMEIQEIEETEITETHAYFRMTKASSTETRGSQPWDINRLNKETNRSSVAHVSIPTQSSSSPTGKQRGGERATKLTSNINDTECTNSDSTKICSNSTLPNAHKILANSTRVNHMRLTPHKYVGNGKRLEIAENMSCHVEIKKETAKTSSHGTLTLGQNACSKPAKIIYVKPVAYEDFPKNTGNTREHTVHKNNKKFDKQCKKNSKFAKDSKIVTKGHNINEPTANKIKVIHVKPAKECWDFTTVPRHGH